MKGRPAEPGTGRKNRVALWVFCILILAAVLCLPVLADVPAMVENISQGPVVAHVGVYVADFRRFSVSDGTVDTNFYLNIRSDDANLSINDFEFPNGHMNSVDIIQNTPEEKNYRIFASLTADPDLRRFPFDNHTLSIIIEPKSLNEKQLIISVDQSQTGIAPAARMPGWEFTGSNAYATNQSYVTDEVPYSRAVFDYGIARDTASTLLKFFLPISLIIVVSLASLLMKVSSRLGLNASMFLAAVLIHWRIADAIPLVAYATFLDMFMIITYATLVMVLVSGILILMYNEAKNSERVAAVYQLSLRIIPAVSITMYFLLFLSLAL